MSSGPATSWSWLATEGLNQAAVGRTRLRVGEGIVGLCAATGAVMNLADAQNHPAFAYRPETGEEPFASMLAVPVRRAGRTLGVLAVQNRAPRHYTEDEVDEVETVAMLLAEIAGGRRRPRMPAGRRCRDRPTRLRRHAADRRHRYRPCRAARSAARAAAPARRGSCRRTGAPECRGRADAARPGRADRRRRARRRQREDATASREVLEAYRLVAADAGWLRRVGEVIRGGVTAEAAVQRVAGELHDRMRRISDPYLRERLADMEDLAGRLLVRIGSATAARPDVPHGRHTARPPAGSGRIAATGTAAGIAGVAIEEASPAGHAAILARALGIPALGGTRGVLDSRRAGRRRGGGCRRGPAVLRPEAEVRQAYVRALDVADRAACRLGAAARHAWPSPLTARRSG